MSRSGRQYSRDDLETGTGRLRRELAHIWQFLLEAALLTTLGGVLGVTIASAIGLTISYFIPEIPAIPPLWAVISGLGVSGVVGIVFGVWPALRAARLDPVESLRYE
jgi:putative ABC transport system permease protein